MDLFTPFPQGARRDPGIPDLPLWAKPIAHAVNWLEAHGKNGRTQAHKAARRDRNIAIYDAIQYDGATAVEIAEVIGDSTEGQAVVWRFYWDGWSAR